MFHRIRALILKELLTIFQDPRARVIVIMPPVLQLLVISFAATQEVRNVDIAVLNRDWGLASQELVSRFAHAQPTFRRVLVVRSAEQARIALDHQRVAMVLAIPPEFSADVAAGRRPEVQLLLDGRRSNAAQVLESYAGTIVQQYARDSGIGGRAGPAAAIEIAPRAWFNPNLNALWSTAPALIAVLLTLTSLVLTALSVARERELGTFEQLLVSPLRPLEIVIGKTVPPFLVGLVLATIMYLAVRLIFQAPFSGSVGLLVLGAAAFMPALIGVGLFISSVTMTQQQAILGAFAFMVPAVLLSGFASPVENIPPWLRWLADINPVRHMVDLMRGLFLTDMPAAVALQSIWPMLAVAAVTLPLATWMFRKRLE